MKKTMKAMFVLAIFSAAIITNHAVQAKTEAKKVTVTVKYQYKDPKNKIVTKSKKYKVNKNSTFSLKYNQMPQVKGWERTGVKAFKVTKDTTKWVKYTKWVPRVTVKINYKYKDVKTGKTVIKPVTDQFLNQKAKDYDKRTITKVREYKVKKGSYFSLGYEKLPKIAGYERDDVKKVKITKDTTVTVNYKREKNPEKYAFLEWIMDENDNVVVFKKGNDLDKLEKWSYNYRKTHKGLYSFGFDATDTFEVVNKKLKLKK